MTKVQEISAQDYNALRASTDAPALIDVRDPWEYELVHLEHAQLRPLGMLREWAQALDKTLPFVLMCHHGGRSALACQMLSALGFQHVTNLDGGIDAWAVHIDASLPR